MKFNTQQEEEVHINLTPLIDVVFLLLIFFMLTTTFVKESQLDINLPQSSSQQKLKTDNVLRIDISAAGEYAVKMPGSTISKSLINRSEDTLLRALKDAAEASPDRNKLITVLRADGKTPHRAVVMALDAAQRLGLVHISFATRQASEQ